MPVLVLFVVLGFVFVIMGVLSFTAVVMEHRQQEREEHAVITFGHVAAK
jgi:hypothetical protein